MRNYFPKRASGAPYHTLSELYDVPVGFANPPPLSFEAVYCFNLRMPNGGNCSISDDFSCSYSFIPIFFFVALTSLLLGFMSGLFCPFIL